MSFDVAVVGAGGYVGRGVVRALREHAEVTGVTEVTRDTYQDARRGSYDVVVNAAMPAARFRAAQDPLWDFEETVRKTADLLAGWNAGKLVQVSSISARTQRDTVYGRHKAAAEALCRPERDLVVRLGPMYSPDLEKGVLVDLLAGRKVWVDASSRYGFAPRDWVAGWIAAHLDRSGVVEVGGRDAIALGGLAARVGADSELEGAVDHQEFHGPPEWPAAQEVVAFLEAWRRAGAAA